MTTADCLGNIRLTLVFKVLICFRFAKRVENFKVNAIEVNGKYLLIEMSEMTQKFWRRSEWNQSKEILIEKLLLNNEDFVDSNSFAERGWHNKLRFF